MTGVEWKELLAYFLVIEILRPIYTHAVFCEEVRGRHFEIHISGVSLSEFADGLHEQFLAGIHFKSAVGSVKVV